MRGGVKCQRFGNHHVSVLTLAGPRRLDNSGRLRIDEGHEANCIIVLPSQWGHGVRLAERAKLALGHALM